MTQKARFWIFLTLCVGLFAGYGSAQVTRADYENAQHLNKKYSKLALNIPDTPVWLGDTDQFVYRKTVEGGHAFFLVDANALTQRSAFDQAKIAAALSAASEKEYKANDLPFPRFRYVNDQSAIEFAIKNTQWHCDLHAYTCSIVQNSHPDDDDFGYDDTPKAQNSESKTKASPDGNWLAFIENYNVFMRAKDGSKKTALSTDGSEGNYYAFDTIAWAPNSSQLMAYRIRPGYHRVIHYVESSPTDQLQPEYSSMVYPKAGDVLALQQPVLFHIAPNSEIPIDLSLFPNPYRLSQTKWWKDGRGFTFEYNQRGHQLYRVIEVDASSRTARALISERSDTFVNYSRLVMNQFDTGKIYRYDVADGNEIIWASERDG